MSLKTEKFNTTPFLVKNQMKLHPTLSPKYLFYLYNDGIGPRSHLKGSLKPLPFEGISSQPWLLVRIARNVFKFRLADQIQVCRLTVPRFGLPNFCGCYFNNSYSD